MRWTDEPNKSFPRWPYHVLAAEAAEPLGPVYVEFWKRVLSDGRALASGSRAEIAVEVVPRSFEGDSPGEATATFRTSVNKQAEGIGIYVLRSEQFTCLQGKQEDDTVYGGRQLAWLLDQYAAIKAALRTKENWTRFEHLNSSYPLAIRAATTNGWFDLQPGSEGFGSLPSEDRALMAGRTPVPEDPLETLTKGVIDARQMKLVEELNAALIQYTPPHFKTISCAITQGVEQGQDALFYDIRCPDFPDEGTTVPNDRVHRAATSLARHLAAEHGTFPEVRITLNLQDDGTWLHGLEFINKIDLS